MTEKQKMYQRSCPITLKPGGRVLIQNLSECRGTGKLKNYWEQQVHVIVSSAGENPVLYKVRPGHDLKEKLRILHRNMLMQCDDLLDNYN